MLISQKSMIGATHIDQPAPAPEHAMKVIHDIGDALGRINFYCEQFKLRTADDLDSANSEMHAIATECHFCIDLIREMSANARLLHSDDFNQHCDVDTTVALALQVHENLWHKNINFEFIAPDHYLTTGAMTENMLFRCLSNLLINARQSIAANGKISVELNEGAPLPHLTCASCQLPIEGDYIQISVTDTGAGIAEQDRANIFKPYFTSKADGDGMGLAIIHDLMHACGGHIHLKSEVGSGSTFRLYLPRAVNRQQHNTSMEANSPC